MGFSMGIETGARALYRSMITPKLLRDWRAYWDDERIRKYFKRRKSLSPKTIARDKSVSLDDRLWVLCHCIWHLDESAARYFAIESAATVTHLAGDKDDQAFHAGLLNWLCEIEDLPLEQRSAAWSTAESTARSAAWSAARSAAWSAARSAAWSAAWSAARSAAWSAAAWSAWSARSAARSATERAAESAALEKSVDRALEWLGPYAEGWED